MTFPKWSFPKPPIHPVLEALSFINFLSGVFSPLCLLPALSGWQGYIAHLPASLTSSITLWSCQQCPQQKSCAWQYRIRDGSSEQAVSERSHRERQMKSKKSWTTKKPEHKALLLVLLSRWACACRLMCKCRTKYLAFLFICLYFIDSPLPSPYFFQDL